MKNISLDIQKIQDDEGDWYWIPSNLIDKFEKDLEEIVGIEYMDSPNKFDEFIDNYSHYRTGGCPSIMPDFYKETN